MLLSGLDTQTVTGPISLPGPLIWSVKTNAVVGLLLARLMGQ